MWGARAIYTENHHYFRTAYTKAGKLRKHPPEDMFRIDIPWDRQDFIGPADERKALSTWINKVGLPLLRKACQNEQWSPPDGEREVRIGQDGYTLVANPRKSHGYLYIAAYKV